MLLIGALKGDLDLEVFDEVIPTSDTPVMTYDALQNTTTFPNVLCYDNNMFLRCGDRKNSRKKEENILAKIFQIRQLLEPGINMMTLPYTVVRRIIKIKMHSSCEIEDFVETRLCKLCVILRSRVLRVECPH